MSRRGYARARSEGLSRKRPGIGNKGRFVFDQKVNS